MPRALFEKRGNAVYISHLDLMRLFQRAFKRAGLPLTHTQGYNPRPSVSIALPLSLGVESSCELLDFDLEGKKLPNEEIMTRLNSSLVSGVRVLEIYDESVKIKHLSYLDCVLTLEYDRGIPAGAAAQIRELFSREEVLMEKKSKTGKVVQQNIIPMIRCIELEELGSELKISARVCCQNPTLNPMQLTAAVAQYIPEAQPDFVCCRRVEIYDVNENVFR